MTTRSVEFTRTPRAIFDTSTGALLTPLSFTRGDSEQIAATLKLGAAVQDLTTASTLSVRLVHRETETVVVVAGVKDTTPTTGKLTATFSKTVTAAMKLGTYRGQIVVTFADASEHTWPDPDSGGHFALIVEDRNPAS